MDRKLTYRPSALADLDDIYAHIAKDNPVRAATFIEELQAQCRKLASLPGTLGRARAELWADLRSFAYQHYVIFFRYLPGELEVVNVIEGHRDIDNMAFG